MPFLPYRLGADIRLVHEDIWGAVLREYRRFEIKAWLVRCVLVLGVCALAGTLVQVTGAFGAFVVAATCLASGVGTLFPACRAPLGAPAPPRMVATAAAHAASFDVPAPDVRVLPPDVGEDVLVRLWSPRAGVAAIYAGGRFLELSEIQRSALLAHEVAHLRFRTASKVIRTVDSVPVLVGAAFATAAAVGLFAGSILAAIAGGVVLCGGQVAVRLWNQRIEHCADALAFQRVPEGIVAFMTESSTFDERYPYPLPQPFRWADALLSTHPSNADRLRFVKGA